MARQRLPEQVAAPHHLPLDGCEVLEAHIESLEGAGAAVQRALVDEQPSLVAACHGAVHAELVDVAGPRGGGALGKRRGGLELDGDVVVDVDLAHDPLELDELLHELFGGDGAAEHLVEPGPREHRLLALGIGLDVGPGALEEGLAEVDEVGDRNAAAPALALERRGQLVFDCAVGIDAQNDALGEGHGDMRLETGQQYDRHERPDHEPPEDPRHPRA